MIDKPSNLKRMAFFYLFSKEQNPGMYPALLGLE
jgi:hypothetical protein